MAQTILLLSQKTSNFVQNGSPMEGEEAVPNCHHFYLVFTNRKTILHSFGLLSLVYPLKFCLLFSLPVALDIDILLPFLRQFYDHPCLPIYCSV